MYFLSQDLKKLMMNVESNGLFSGPTAHERLQFSGYSSHTSYQFHDLPEGVREQFHRWKCGFKKNQQLVETKI